jgi:hypothetical protein
LPDAADLIFGLLCSFHALYCFPSPPFRPIVALWLIISSTCFASAATQQLHICGRY